MHSALYGIVFAPAFIHHCLNYNFGKEINFPESSDKPEEARDVVGLVSPVMGKHLPYHSELEKVWSVPIGNLEIKCDRAGLWHTRPYQAKE